MNGIVIFIIALLCILAADLLTGVLLTSFYTSTGPLDQTYLFYVLAAILIAIVMTLVQRKKVLRK